VGPCSLRPTRFRRVCADRIALGDGADRAGEQPALRQALAALVDYTATAASGYAAIWEGWTSRDDPPKAPRVLIPNRRMLLFTGPVDELRAQGRASSGLVRLRAGRVYEEPHLVWPEDRAWCLACEVDEEIEFTVGCSIEASEGLARALPVAVRRTTYGASAPMYRE